MFKIIKDGTSLGMTEAPTYVRQAENGCFVLCQESEATGIAYGGTVYHILGREAVEGAESVVMEEVDAGQEIEKTAATNGIVFTTMAEAGNIDDGRTRRPVFPVGVSRELHDGSDQEIHGRETV